MVCSARCSVLRLVWPLSSFCCFLLLVERVCLLFSFCIAFYFGVVVRFACFGAETGRVLETDLPDLRSRVDAADLSRAGCWNL